MTLKPQEEIYSSRGTIFRCRLEVAWVRGMPVHMDRGAQHVVLKDKQKTVPLWKENLRWKGTIGWQAENQPQTSLSTYLLKALQIPLKVIIWGGVSQIIPVGRK